MTADTHELGIPVDDAAPARASLPIRLAFLLAYIALVNGPFWILARFEFVNRAWVSLDSLLALVILQFSSILGAIAIAGSWLLDLLVNASYIYHFGSPLEALHSYNFLGYFNFSKSLDPSLAFSTAPFLVSALLLRYMRRRLRIGFVIPISAIVVALLLDSLNGSSALLRRDARFASVNIAGSSGHALLRAALDYDAGSRLEAVRTGTGGVAEFEKNVAPIAALEQNVIYLIVESLGSHRNPRVRQYFASQLFPPMIASSYELTETSVKFLGGTTDGELRRLCGLSGSYRRFEVANGEDCIPNAFAAHGFATVGLHGFTEYMFNRREWWPWLGLQSAMFAEQLESSQGLCDGAFRGICDEQLVMTAFALADKPRTFVYAVTLNSHLPMAPIEIPPGLDSVCASAATGHDVCMMLAYQGVVMRTVAQQLQRADIKPIVVVVGDHAPPFVNKDSRAQFDQDEVPMYVLRPR